MTSLNTTGTGATLPPDARSHGLTPLEAENENSREERRRVLDTLKATLSTQPIEEPRSSENRLALASGVHGGMRLVKTDTEIRGLGADPVVGRLSTISADAFLHGLTFKFSEAIDRAELVRITDGACVCIAHAQFRKVTGGTSVHIVVEAGCQLVLMAPLFRGGASGGFVIDNQAAKGDVVLIGARNKTGNSLSNVTVLGDAGTPAGPPCITRTITGQLIVSTDETCLFRDSVTADGAEVVIEGTGEVLSL